MYAGPGSVHPLLQLQLQLPQLLLLEVSSLETSLSETFSEISESSISGSWSPPQQKMGQSSGTSGSTDSVSTITLTSPTKPSLLRKKSGDVVKSSLKLPQLARCKSALNVSTPMKKNVSFALILEKVKMFDGKDSPSTVSSPCASPPHRVKPMYFSLDWPSYNHELERDNIYSEDCESESEDDEVERKSWEISSSDINGSTTLNDVRPVFLKSIQVSLDKKSLFGFILVKNLAFEKKISIKLTTNNWKSSIIISNSTYMQSFRQGNFDQFKFSMPLSSYKNIINIEMVIKYEVGYPSQIYWDNNNGLNYHLTIKALPSTISRKNSVPEFEDLVNRLVNMKRESKKYEDDLDDQDDSDTLSITPRLKSSFNRYNFNNSEQELPKRPALKTSFSNSDVGNVKPRYSNSYKARQQKGLDNDSTSSNVSHISASSTNLALSQDTNFNSKSYSDLIASMCFYQGDSTTPKSNSSSSSTNLHCKIEQEPSFQNIPIGSRLSSASTFHSFSDSIHI